MARLGNYIRQVRGVSYKPGDLFDSPSPDAITVLRANNITDDGEITLDDVVWVAKERVKEQQLIKAEDILVCASSGSKNLVGKAAQAEKDLDVAFGAFCKVVRPMNANKKYIGYFFQSPIYRRSISYASAGVNINNIRSEDLDALAIDLPDADEQAMRVNKLEKLARSIALRKKQLDKIDLLIKSQFIEMFGDGQFETVAIRELVELKVESAKKKHTAEDSIRYIDISSIDNKLNTMTGFTVYRFGDAPSRAQQCLREFDIVVSTVRPNLRNIAMNHFRYKNLVASSGFCILRAKNCNPQFLFNAILLDDFSRKMSEATTGANYPAIKDSDVLSYKVPHPPIDLQNQFAAFVEQTDKSKIPFEMEVAA